MGKKQKKKTTKVIKEEKEMGDQLDLIDVAPQHAKEIATIAKRYKAAQARRLKALDEETAEKQKLLDLVNKENLQRLEDGTRRFRVDGLIIKLTPRDELVQIKEEKEKNDNNE